MRRDGRCRTARLRTQSPEYVSAQGPGSSRETAPWWPSCRKSLTSTQRITTTSRTSRLRTSREGTSFRPTPRLLFAERRGDEFLVEPTDHRRLSMPAAARIIQSRRQKRGRYTSDGSSAARHRRLPERLSVATALRRGRRRGGRSRIPGPHGARPRCSSHRRCYSRLEAATDGHRRRGTTVRALPLWPPPKRRKGEFHEVPGPVVIPAVENTPRIRMGRQPNPHPRNLCPLRGLEGRVRLGVDGPMRG
jgi:hypothetical protein